MCAHTDTIGHQRALYAIVRACEDAQRHNCACDADQPPYMIYCQIVMA